MVDPSNAYFDSTSHSFPFFIGSALGALFGIRLHPKLRERLERRNAARVSALAMVLAVSGLLCMAAVFHFSEKRTYRYGTLLASLLSALLILAARMLHEAAPTWREPKLVKALANLSYPIYLFHWPLYIVFSECLPYNWLASLVTLLLTLLFSILVTYGIEPLLRGKKLWQKPRAAKFYYPALAVVLLLALLGSARTLWRAPAITALEQGIINGEMYRQADRVAVLEKQAKAMNPAPVNQKSTLILSYADAPRNAVWDDWTPAVSIPTIPGGVVFIGDSVSLGANRLLTDTVPDSVIDSETSRSLAKGREILKNLAARGELPEYVVVSLGANGYGAWAAQIDGMVDELPAGRRLIFVTPYTGKRQEGLFVEEIATYYRTLAKTHSFITVADWAKLISSNTQYLAADRIHFGNVRKCSQMFVDLVMMAIQEAGLQDAKP
jgi:hypothetical protein